MTLSTYAVVWIMWRNIEVGVPISLIASIQLGGSSTDQGVKSQHVITGL